MIGPRQSDEDAALARAWRADFAVGVNRARAIEANICGCIGPQPGETLCPCMLRAENEKAQRMLSEGVVIDGQLYRLVPATPPACNSAP